MKQLALDLAIEEVEGLPIQLTGELQEQLIALMARALLALVLDDPRPEAREEMEDDDE